MVEENIFSVLKKIVCKIHFKTNEKKRMNPEIMKLNKELTPSLNCAF